MLGKANNMGIKSGIYNAVVLSRKIYYNILLGKPRIVFTESNLKPYKKSGSGKYLASFK